LKKEEIVLNANQLGLGITDSIFRNYVRLGLITSIKNGLGYGKGVSAEYPEKIIEVLSKIERYKKKGYQLKEIIFLLFSDGYPVDIEKLKKQLANHTEEMLEDLKTLVQKLDERENIEYAIDTYLLKEIRIKQSGRPSNEKALLLEDKRRFEKQKIEYTFQFLLDFFEKGEIEKTSTSLFKYLGYEKEITNLKIPPNLAISEKWIKDIEGSLEEDYKEIYRFLCQLKDYYKFFLSNGHDSQVYKEYIQPLKKVYKNSQFKNLFEDPNLIKLLIIILIMEPNWRRNLLYLFSLDNHIKNYDDLVNILPIVLNQLDEIMLNKGVTQ
jgi:DNA-binding transcriptional MerR regulator